MSRIRHDADLVEKNKQIGRQIRKKRRALDLSQTELSKIIGVSFQQVQKYECGSNNIPVVRLIQFANALNVDVMCLLEEPTNAR